MDNIPSGPFFETQCRVMQSSTDHHHHHSHHQHQQQTASVRPHSRLRRSHSPLYNYTALWAHDLLARGPQHITQPDSSSSTNSFNPIAVHDRNVSDRRRWTRCVCVGFVACLLVNIASIVFVSVTLGAADDLTTGNAPLQQFMNQAS